MSSGSKEEVISTLAVGATIGELNCDPSFSGKGGSFGGGGGSLQLELHCQHFIHKIVHNKTAINILIMITSNHQKYFGDKKVVIKSL